jgi:diguanylate cyclase (GGDEF)-like protein/PAS domain S-box-containing protein
MSTDLRILLVEDDSTDRQLIRITLEKGLEQVLIEEAATRSQFNKALDNFDYDLVVTDYKLKGFTGFDVLEAIRAKELEVPVILLTGMGDEKIAMQAIKAGVDDYVSKSLEHIKRLPAKIAAIVERRSMQQNAQADDSAVYDPDLLIGAFEGSPVGVIFVDVENYVAIEMNEAACQLLGYDKNEFTGLKSSDVTHPDDREITIADNKKIASGGVRDYHYTRRYRHKKGHYIWCDITNSAVQDKKGSNLFFIIQLVDVSERIQSEEKFRNLLESAPDAMLISNENEEIVLINQQTELMFLYSAEELIGESIEKLFIRRSYGADVKKFHDHFNLLGERGVQERVSLYAVDRQGREFPVEISLSAFDAEQGRLFAAAVRDVANRKQMESALRKQTESTRLLGKLAIISSEAKNIHQALQNCLKDICMSIEWPVGHIYYPAKDSSEEFISSGIWHLHEPDKYNDFCQATEKTRSSQGVTLPGEVLKSGAPVWLYADDVNAKSIRRQAVRAVGIRTGFAFPVFVKEQIFAVIELFSHELVPEDKELLEIVSHAGAQLGRAIERKQVDELLRKSEEKFSTAFRSSPDAISISSIIDGTIIEVNDSFLELSGFSHEQIAGHTEIDLDIWVDIEQREELVRNLQEYTFVHGMDVEHKMASGEIRNCQLSAEVISIQEQSYMLVIRRDVTEQKQAEWALEQSHRALQVLNECNHTIVHATTGQELINEICRIIVATGGYRFAWVGYSQSDESKTIYPVASAGYEAGYLDNNFSWSEGGHKYDPVSDAIITGEPCVVNDLTGDSAYESLRSAALERGYRSEIALPIKAGHMAFGALMIYSSEVNAFDQEEEKLLCRLTDNMAFGILSLRARSEAENAQYSLLESEKKYRLLYDENPTMFFTIDTHGIILSVNQFGAGELGYTVDELTGTSVFDLFTDAYKHSAIAKLQECVKQPRQIAHWELQKVTKDDRILWVRESARVVKNSSGEDNIFIVCEDITETRELSEQLTFQATHDSLTGLINRGEFERRLDRLIKNIQDDASVHALCYLDLDQFKVINDTCGHVAGDELLRQLGTTLRSHIRMRDTVARLGGDEFGILMEHCVIEKAEQVAKNLLRAISEIQFAWEDKNFRIGVSIGLVPVSISSGNMTNILKKADSACYVAKDEGRNRIHVYREDEKEISKRQGELVWVSRIQDALDNNQFELYFQLITSLQGKRSKQRHYEVLLRMQTDDGELILPEIFLPAAERYNLSTKIDRWVLSSLFRSIAGMSETDRKELEFSINLSGLSLSDTEFLDFVVEQIDETGMIAKNICFEITETIAISNLSSATKMIDVLTEKGCSFALDDFGSGLSSFAYLKKLNVAYLKIDGVFVRDIVEDKIDLAIVKSMHEIGKALGKKTIAEFAENDKIIKMLTRIGVDYAQGYGISKPQTIEELLSSSSRNVIEFTKRKA